MPRNDSKARAQHHAESIRDDAAAETRHARLTLLGMFALLGITMSSWLSRIPSIRDALDLSTSTLGVVLLAGAVGGLLTVTVAGPMVTRWGGRLAFLVSAAAFAVGFVLLGVGPATGSVALLATGIFLSGVGAALGNVVLNVESAGVERRLGRTVLPQFHAAFSIGAVIGSLLGAACAWADVPVAVQLVATAVLATAWRLHAVRAIIHDTARGAGAGAGTGTGSRADAGVEPAVHGTLGDAVADVETVHAPRAGRGVRLGAALGAWREPRTLLIGLVVLAAALSEGAANDWLSIAVVDGFDSPEAVGGLVFGTFVAAMTVMRLAGTRLLDRFGRVAVLRASGLTSIVGLLLFGFAPTLGLAGIGVVLWGFGAALAVPVGIAAASDDPRRAAARVSVVSAFASVASLAAPPLLGFAAEHVGARHALVLIVAGMLLSTLVAGAVRRVEAPGYARPAPVPSNPSPEGHAPGVRTPSSDTVHEGASA